MIDRLEHCMRHVIEHIPRVQWYQDNPELLTAGTLAGIALREKLSSCITISVSERQDRGIEIGFSLHILRDLF